MYSDYDFPLISDISLVRKQLGFEMPVLIFPLVRPEVQTVSSHLQVRCLKSVGFIYSYSFLLIFYLIG